MLMRFYTHRSCFTVLMYMKLPHWETLLWVLVAIWGGILGVDGGRLNIGFFDLVTFFQSDSIPVCTL